MHIEVKKEYSRQISAGPIVIYFFNEKALSFVHNKEIRSKII